MINEREYVNIVIKNIRVLKKINQIIDGFLKVSQDELPVLIIEDFIKRAIFLSKCFYETNNKVPFEIIKNPSSVTEYKILNTAIKGHEEIQEANAKEYEEKKFKGEYDQSLYQKLMLTAQQLQIDRSSVFTEEIIHNLEHGVWSEENITKFLSSEIKRIDVITKQNERQKRLNCAWTLYHKSFEHNIDDIVSIFKEELEYLANYTYWDYGHFIHTTSAYYDFKKLEDPTFSVPLHYIDRYIEINKEMLEQMSWKDRMYISINLSEINSSINNYAMQQLDNIKSQKSKIPLSEFVKSLHDSGLNNEQETYIKNLTQAEIENWLKDLNDPLMSVYINKLRYWSTIIKNSSGTNDPSSDTLIDLVLKKISASSPLNKYRIERLIKPKL
ncbi:hypothetical protein [Ignatzschineria sp. LJL83]